METRAIRLGVGAVIFRANEVLLIRRGKPPFEGAWSIPGGAPHFGETLEAATLREVREETGVAAEIRGFLGVYEFLPGAD
ncbi:MAG: NUDIX domain-containing protein, partial [Parvularculaceae bacterium]|nr:NUDIX domain-containing protein [Parvularculaceae bacterium]